MKPKWIAVAAFILAPAAAHAQALQWSNPESFRQAMAAAGYEAELFHSNEGTARINAHLRGSQDTFNIDFLPCGDDMNEDCRAIEFSAPTVLDSVPSLRAAWNVSRGRPPAAAVSYGQDGYEDDVRMELDMHVEVPGTGLARAQFLAKLRSWQAMFDVYQRMVDQAPAAH